MKYSKIEKKIKLDLNYKDKPYVVKNYAKNWSASKKWTFNYIKNIKGSNLKVNTVRGNAALGEGKITSISFKKYISQIVSNKNKTYLTTFYLFKKFPKLIKDINYDYIKSNSLFCHVLSWIGPKNSITGFHCDWSETINVQVRGEKIFYVVSPRFNKFMYISDKFERISSTSEVDLKKIKSNKFPLFKKANVIKVHLKKGDLIYIPRGWWHYVRSLKPSIGVSFHFWNFKNFFRDLLYESIKVFLHDIGLFKRNKCACHSFDKNGNRFKRG